MGGCEHYRCKPSVGCRSAPADDARWHRGDDAARWLRVQIWLCARGGLFKYTFQWCHLQTGCFAWIRMRDARSTVGRTLCPWRRSPPGDRTTDVSPVAPLLPLPSCSGSCLLTPFNFGVLPIRMKQSSQHEPQSDDKESESA